MQKKVFDCEIEKIVPYKTNNKKHPKEQIDMIINSINECGFLNPVIVDEDFVILAGHGRLQASMKMDLKKIPVIQYIGLNDKQKQKFRILDNRIADFSEYDIENLALELGEIGEHRIDGLFKDMEIPWGDKIQFDEDKEDVVPNIEEKPIIVERGDIFQLGDHRLICGDSTDYEDIKKLMNGTQGDMVFTDPPYNINYKGMGKNTSQGIKNDNLTDEAFCEFLDKTFANYSKIINKKAGVYIFHSSSTQSQFEYYIRRNGFEIKNQIIRNKPMASLGWGDYRRKHEPFFYCCLRGETPNFYGDRTHGTVIDLFGAKSDTQILNIIKKAREFEREGKTTIRSMSRDNVNEYVHPTQKPVQLISYAIENSSKENQIVVDLFGGSGSTIIACEKTGRIGYTMELDPYYVQTILQRYHFYTEGKKEIKCLNRNLDSKKIING